MVGDRVGLRSDLDRLAAAGTRHLRRWRLRLTLRRSVRGALALSFVAPAAVVLLQLVTRLSGAPVWSPGLPVLLGLAFLGPATWVAGSLVLALWRRRPRRCQALALFDEHLSSSDRLVTADTFLAAPRRSAFMEAAVDDAVETLASAASVTLPPPALPGWQVAPRAWWSVPLTLVLLAVSLWLGAPAIAPASAPPASLPQSVEAVEAAGSRAAREVAHEPTASRRQPTSRVGEQPALPSDPTQRPPAEQPRPALETEGSAGAGRQSSTLAASNAAASTGRPSDQSSPSDRRDARPPDGPEPPRATQPPAPTRQPQRPQPMGSTSGQGRSKSSSSSLSQIPSEDEPDTAGLNPEQPGPDEDVEEEDEEEKSGGATTPSLKRKRPPENRNSTLPTAARGPLGVRGGKSGLKKTRGVPSMILGIPIADRIKGMRNAGRSIVSQENSRPREEPFPALAADPRLARTGSLGHMQHPRMTLWMQQLVARYFLSQRQAAGTVLPPSPSRAGAIAPDPASIEGR